MLLYLQGLSDSEIINLLQHGRGSVYWIALKLFSLHWVKETVPAFPDCETNSLQMCAPGSSDTEYTLSLKENSEKDAVLAEDIGLYSR